MVCLIFLDYFFHFLIKKVFIAYSRTFSIMEFSSLYIFPDIEFKASSQIEYENIKYQNKYF